MSELGLQNKFNDYVFENQKKEINKTVGTQVSEKKLGELKELIKDSPLSDEQKNALTEAVKTGNLSDSEKVLINSFKDTVKSSISEIKSQNKNEVNQYNAVEFKKEFKMPE